MPKSLIVPVVNFRHLPPLFCLSMGALLAVLVTVFVLSQRHGNKNAQLFDEFGTALANLTAQESVNASAERDRLRLQALLQGVVAQPRVAMASAYDAQHTLLVQAGEALSSDQAAVYSAEIRVQNAVIGHVSLVIDTRFRGDSTLRWTLLAIVGLLLIMAGLALYECFGDIWYLEVRPWPRKPKPASVPVAQPAQAGVPKPAGGPAAGGPAAVEEPTGEDASQHSDLIIYLRNRKRLKEQLNSETFSACIKRFERLLNRVLALYGGVRVASESAEDYYCVRFMSQESVADASFRAVCAAHLLSQLSQQQKVRLETLAQICTHDCDVKLALNETGIYLQRSVLDEALRARLVLRELDAGRAHVEGFNDVTAALLTRQQAQISKSLA